MIMEDMTYKTQKKIDRAKDKLSMTISYVQVNHQHNKIYKLFKELADEMIDSVQYVINHRGAYENAGWDEAGEFMDIVDGCSSNIITPLRHNLQDYIEILINKLKY